MSLLKESLDLDNLIANKIPIHDPTSKYESIIRIDFSGIAGTTLLINRNNNKIRKEINNLFVKLFENLSYLEQKKIRIKTRFLFSYLYSDFAFALIEAEKTPYRATKSNKTTLTKNPRLFSLSREDFFGSSIFQDQKLALSKLQNIYNENCRPYGSKDILNIRFSCLPLNFCYLTINKNSFIDSYTYAKESSDHGLSYDSPVVMVSQGKNDDSFSTLEDHFRYIWLHPTTLFFEDATNANFLETPIDLLENLFSFKDPTEITFEKKAQKYISNMQNELAEEELNRWKFKVERIFSTMTRKIEESPEQESIFMGFSFANGLVKIKSISEFIQEDFPDSINVNIVDLWGKGKGSLFQEITKNLDSATLGLILFTKDIEEINEKTIHYYSRPNLYFEYGYLLKQVEKYGNPMRRVMILAEDKSVIPTDMQDLAREVIDPNIYLLYIKVLRRLLEVNKCITFDKANKAIECFEKRMKTAYINGFIKDEEINNEKFAEFLSRTVNELKQYSARRFKKSVMAKNKSN